jgi:alanine dehydrogenase
MIIGVPKEIKNNENRVALTPAGTQELTKRGHTVYVQTKAGEGSGFNDPEYIHAGGKILGTAKEVFDIAEMILKVKEPIEAEYGLIKRDQLVFTYFHFASYEPLKQSSGMIKVYPCWSRCLKWPVVWPFRKEQNTLRNLSREEESFSGEFQE